MVWILVHNKLKVRYSLFPLLKSLTTKDKVVSLQVINRTILHFNMVSISEIARLWHKKRLHCVDMNWEVSICTSTTSPTNGGLNHTVTYEQTQCPVSSRPHTELIVSDHNNTNVYVLPQKLASAGLSHFCQRRGSAWTFF